MPSLPLALLALLPRALASAFDGTNSTANGTGPAPLGQRAVFGLPAGGSQVNGIYVGWMPDWSEDGGVANVTSVLRQDSPIIGDYITMYDNTTAETLETNLGYHSYKQYAGKSVVNLAIVLAGGFNGSTVSTGFNSPGSTQATALAQACAWLNSNQGVTVWLRLAYEMNGSWMPYGLDPAGFLAGWTAMRTALTAAGATDTYMLWSPNVWDGAKGSPNDPQAYAPYYPGDDQVDLVGLSLYWLGDDQTENTYPSSSYFVDEYSYFASQYGHKPMLVSETASPMHYLLPATLVAYNSSDGSLPQPYVDVTTLTPNPADASNGVTQLKMVQNWLGQLTGSDAAGKFPNLTAVCWFNTMKVRNYLINDFRAVNGDPSTEAWVAQFLSASSSYNAAGSLLPPALSWTVGIALAIAAAASASL